MIHQQGLIFIASEAIFEDDGAAHELAPDAPVRGHDDANVGRISLPDRFEKCIFLEAVVDGGRAVLEFVLTRVVIRRGRRHEQVDTACKNRIEIIVDS